MKRNFVYLVLVVCILATTQGCQPKPQILSIQGPTMGTSYHVKWVDGDGSWDAQTIQADINQSLALVNKKMSTYDSESELSRFNRLPANQSFLVSNETAYVIREAIRLGEVTHGILDVTVGPLVNLWGFGPQARPEVVPSSETIVATKARTGLRYLSLDDQRVTKHIDDLYVDLSTIAKGYGVDVLAELLEQKGIENYLVEVGGEMRLSGTKPDGVEWRVAVEKPVSTERAVAQVISVGNNAVATSGDYRNYYEQDGVRYSHLINPNTGYPIQHNLVSVTVVHPSCMTADGLATAINVMGKEMGMTFATEQKLAVLMIVRENGEFKAYNTPEFETYLRN